MLGPRNKPAVMRSKKSRMAALERRERVNCILGWQRASFRFSREML